MNWILPAAAALLIVLAIVRDLPRYRVKFALDIGQGLWLLALAIGGSAVIARYDNDAVTPCATLIVLASVGSWVLGRFGDKFSVNEAPIAIGMGAFLASVGSAIPSFAEDQFSAKFAAVTAMALGTLITRSTVGAVATAALATMSAADALGGYASDGVGAQHAGTAVALVVGIAALLTTLVPKWPNRVVRSLVMAVAVAIIGYAMGEKVTHFHAGAICAILGVVAAVLTEFTLEGAAHDPVRRVLCVVIWLGATSVTFAQAHALGMAIATGVGAVYLIAVGSESALVLVAPAFGLVLARVLREAYPDSARALDLGQQYAVVGLAIGFTLPHAIASWRKDAEGGLGGWAWGGALMAIVAAAMILTGAKGGYGLLIGAGLAGVATTARASTFAITSAVGGAIILSYGWFENTFSAARDERVRLAVGAGVILVLAIVLLALDARLVKRAVAR